MDLEEAAALLSEKLGSKSFRKAVGPRVAEAVETLLNFYRCGGCLGVEEARRLINDFYVFESRISRILELYDRLSRGGLRVLAREVLGDDFPLEPIESGALVRELEAYRRSLLAVAGRALRCYSSANSKA